MQSERVRVLSVLLVLGMAGTGTSADAPESDARTTGAQWSNHATALLGRGPMRCAEIPSPDASLSVLVGQLSFAVAASGRVLSGPDNADVQALAELSWAPDSRAFFVTESHGGWVGEWRVSVFTITGGSVQRLDVTRAVVDAFRKRYACHEPEDPNVGAVTWVRGSSQLLVVAEVPPHSSCPDMGMVRGYVVEVPGGTIVSELTEEELRAKWVQHLGVRLSRER